MRTTKFIRNSIYSLGFYLVIFILGLISRRVFIDTLGIETLGLQGVYLNIVSIISIIEFGFGSVITYRLYKEVSQNNVKEINYLLNVFRKIYKVIGIAIFILGISFLPIVFILSKGYSYTFGFITITFILYVFSGTVNYFFSYKRIIFLVNQEEFILVKIDSIVQILGAICKIVILIYTQNFIFFIAVVIFQNIISNLLVSFLYFKKYSIFSTKISTQIKDIKAKGIFEDSKQIIVHNIAYIIYFGVDNIVITLLFGLATVGKYVNYILLQNQLWLIFLKIVKPIQNSIGSFVNDENRQNKEVKKELFDTIDLMLIFFASIISICFFISVQWFVTYWLGDKYLLSITSVILISLIIYFQIIGETVYYFRTTFGNYGFDKKYMIFAAVLNLLISVLLGKFIGLDGVLIGTLVGLLIIWLGRIKFVFNFYLSSKYKSYILKHTLMFALFLALSTIVYFMTNNLQISVFNFFLKVLIAVLVLMFVEFAIFYKSKSFGNIIMYIKKIRRV